MKPFRKLLVPTDFSTLSAGALEVAADLSRRYEASVSLLHVCEHELFSVPESPLLYDAAQLPRLMDHYKQLLENMRNDLRAAGVMSVDTELRQGHVYSEIVRFAEQGNYDLIVMSTHGRTGLAHAVLGSVAERVSRTAPCAVLTVRPSETNITKSNSAGRASV